MEKILASLLCSLAILFIILIIVTNSCLLYNLYHPSLSQQNKNRYATQQSEQQMVETFYRDHDVILATIPYDGRFSFSPGEEVPFKIGIYKMSPGTQGYEYFSLCIGQFETAKCVTPSESNPVAAGNSGIKFRFLPKIKLVNLSEMKILPAVMMIPKNIEEDAYGFRIYICAVNNETQLCNGLEDSFGSYDFLVDVQSSYNSDSYAGLSQLQDCDYIVVSLIIAILLVAAIIIWLKHKKK